MKKTNLIPAACAAGPAAAVSGAGYGRIRRARHLAAANGSAAAVDVGAGHHQHAAVLFGCGCCRAGCQFLPDIPAIQSMAVDVIANLNDQSTTFMASFAAITTVVSASGGMAAVQKGLQKLTPGARKTMFDRLWAVLYTFLFEGLMLAAMVVQSLSPILRGLAGLLPLHTLVGGLLQRLHSLLSISAVLSLALSLLTVTLIYTYVPGGKRRMRDQLPGAAAVVAVWTLFSKIFSFYIGHFWKLSYIYGSLAAIVLITLWLNVNINVLFLGAGLNAKIQGWRGRKGKPDA